jgi:hypothetical protein
MLYNKKKKKKLLPDCPIVQQICIEPSRDLCIFHSIGIIHTLIWLQAWYLVLSLLKHVPVDLLSVFSFEHVLMIRAWKQICMCWKEEDDSRSTFQKKLKRHISGGFW